MRTGHADRLWQFAGALAAVVMLALGWFLFISPQHAETDRLNGEAAEARSRVSSLEHRLAELRTQNAKLPEYKSELDRNRRALPSTSGLSDFLREMQSAGERTGVSVSGLIVGTPTPALGGGPNVVALPISLTAGGDATKLNNFLDQLQEVQPRAVLVSSVNLSPADERGPLSGSVTLTLSMQAFIATKGEPVTVEAPSSGADADPATAATN